MPDNFFLTTDVHSSCLDLVCFVLGIGFLLHCHGSQIGLATLSSFCLVFDGVTLLRRVGL